MTQLSEATRDPKWGDIRARTAAMPDLIERARKAISQACDRDRSKWRMSVPVQHDDDDVVLVVALDELSRLRSRMAETRALLRVVWQCHDAAGMSMGRGLENSALEAAMEILGPCDPALAKEVDADPRAFVEKLVCPSAPDTGPAEVKP